MSKVEDSKNTNIELIESKYFIFLPSKDTKNYG